MTDKQKLVDKIRALLNKSASSEHEAEASAFLDKAQELMERYQIEAAELGDNSDPVKVEEGIFSHTVASPSWYSRLYEAVAQYYGCTPLRGHGPIKTRPGLWRNAVILDLVGRESAIATTQVMYSWIKDQVLATGKKLAKDNQEDFFMGSPKFNPSTNVRYQTRLVANSLVIRLHELVRQRNPHSPQSPQAKNALVTLDQVEQAIAKHYKDRIKEVSGYVSMTSSQAAIDAANNINLCLQTGQGGTLTIGKEN